MEAAAFFEIVEQHGDDFIQQAEATPQSVTAVAGLVGWVASGLNDFYLRLLIFDCKLVTGI